MTEQRRYAGQSSQERRQARRDRLIEAGLEVFGTTGFATSSIERLCARASVSNRYFYDLFDSREALLQAVYDEVFRAAAAEGLLAVHAEQTRPVERLVTGVGTYVRVITTDPRRTRVVHHEVRTVAAMAARRRETAEWVAERMREIVGAAPDPDGGPFVPGLAVLGAVSEVLARWTTTTPRPPVGPVVGDLSSFIVDAVGGYLTSESGPGA